MCLELIIHARSVICTRLYSRRDGTVQYLTGRDAQRGRLFNQKTQTTPRGSR